MFHTVTRTMFHPPQRNGRLLARVCHSNWPEAGPQSYEVESAQLPAEVFFSNPPMLWSVGFLGTQCKAIERHGPVVLRIAPHHEPRFVRSAQSGEPIQTADDRSDQRPQDEPRLARLRLTHDTG